MPKLAARILFSKHNANAKPDFCKACTLRKQYKVHSKEPPIDTTNKAKVRLHADFFGGRNLLLGVWSYKYGAIYTYEATWIKFLTTMKSKDAICKESKIFFRKIETFTSKKIQYFWSNNAKKYQLLVFDFEKKVIVWEKSASYTQDQDRVAERSIRTIIEIVCTMLINAKLPTKRCPKAVYTARYITNRLPTKPLQKKTICKARPK